MLTREHLFAVKLSNDNLSEFLNSWDEVMLEMIDEIDEGTLAMQFRKGFDLKDYLKQYDMDRFRTGEENNYRALYHLAQRIVDERLLSGNSIALDPTAKCKGKGATGKGGEKGWNKGKPQDPAVKMEQGDCRAWCIYGKCPRGDDCQFVHSTSKRGKTAKSTSQAPRCDETPDPKKGKGKGKDRDKKGGGRGK